MNESNTGYIVEFVQHGRSMKVTAFDPDTLIEASVIGARGATQQQLAELAIRKLRYVIQKKRHDE